MLLECDKYAVIYEFDVYYQYFMQYELEPRRTDISPCELVK